MKLLGCTLCLAVLLVATCLVTAAKDGAAAERKLNIDPALRKALLRALRHLKERQEEEKQEQLLGDANTTEENFATTILDELLEESTVSDGEEEARVRGSDTPAIDYHTYVASSQREDTDTIEGEVEQQESGPVTIGSEGANEIIKTIIIAKPRSTLSTPKLESENEIVPPAAPLDGSTVALGSTATPSTTTSPLPASATSTTAVPVPTTPAPTHNEDGENIEKVKSEDVKIFQAPLVAAFTVQQDQLGVSRNVIPLLQTPPKQQSAQRASAALPKGSATAATTGPVPTLLPPLVPATAPSDVTRALEEKTRQLEQQLIALQNQQRAQEQLLRAKLQQEQAIIQQQQLQLQQQKQRLEEETRLRIQRFEQDQRIFRQQQQQQQLFQQQQQHQQQQHQQQQQQQFQPQPPSQQQLPPFKPQQQPLAPQPTFIQELPRPGPAVQFIPSVSLPGGKPIPISVEQQLPFKEAVDFQPARLPQQPLPQTSTTVEQVKAISQPAPPLPPQPPQLARDQPLPLKPFQPFNLFPVLPPLLVGPSPFDQQLPPVQQRNRVFRQEPSTGNFGLNQQPFRPSQPLAFASDSQNLQNLLFQSGITSRSAEDFNIITKVLALNHGIPQASSQRMFAKLSPEQQRQLLFRK